MNILDTDALSHHMKRNAIGLAIEAKMRASADPDFWNPKVRVPMCVNAAAARTYLRYVATITELALAGRTPSEVNDAIVADRPLVVVAFDLHTAWANTRATVL